MDPFPRPHRRTTETGMAQRRYPVTILLVEDDDVEAERVTRAFRHAGCDLAIRRAWDGIEALAILRRETPPPLDSPVIVLLDLKMPRMDGIQFLDELRADASLRQTLVFVLTTSQNEQDRIRAYERQVAGYILKTKARAGFSEVVHMLDNYSKLIDFPEGDRL